LAFAHGSRKFPLFFSTKILKFLKRCVTARTRTGDLRFFMKKILLLHCGGTFGMAPQEPDQVLAPSEFQHEILEYVPELRQLAQIDIRIPFNLDSSNVGLEEWSQLAGIIYDHMDAYDGFVVIHGTDTMAYTASALSFSLLNVRKPVILTGAQRPLSQLRNDARSNLIDAVELATMDIPEVMIVFGQRILRGNRSKKINVFSYEAFDSPNFPYLGRIGVTIEIDRSRILKVHGTPVLLKGFNPSVSVISIQPSMNPREYMSLLDTELQAFLLVGFGSGNLPGERDDWVKFISEAHTAGKAVFVGSQLVYGGTNLERYKCGQRAMQAGAHGIGQMTIEAAYVKLQKILALTSDRQTIYNKFYQDWAGEL